MGKAYTGVDIGTDSLKLAVCDGDAIRTAVVETLPEGMMADGRPVSLDAMADFIKGVVRASGSIAKDAAFVVPANDSLVRRISVPAMTEKELELNLPYEFRDYISQGKDRYVYDYAVLGTQVDEQGIPQSMDLLAVAVMKQTVADYAEMFRRAGMKLRVALPVQAAYQNLVGGNPRALANCCIIDFAHAQTTLYFFANGTYDATRTIEMGGVDLDRAIADACGVDVHVAAGYKLANYENVLTGPASLAVYESVAVEISRALNFYGFNNPDTAVEAAYCGGGGSLVQPLVNAVAAQTDIELRAITDIMPPAQGDDVRALCPAAVGATLKAR